MSQFSKFRTKREKEKEKDLLYYVFILIHLDGPVVSIDLATGYGLDTLREGDDLKFVCDVDSNPPPTSIVWYHKVRIEFLLSVTRNTNGRDSNVAG